MPPRAPPSAPPLPPDLAAFVAAEVGAGRHHDAAGVVRAALRLLQGDRPAGAGPEGAGPEDAGRAEAALRESEARFRGFAENSADVLWIAAPDGARLEYLSPAFDAVFGAPRDPVARDPGRWAGLVHPEDRDAFAGLLPRVLAGEAAVAHYRVVRPVDGRVVHLRDTGFPIRDAAGAVARAAGVVQDITDIHAAAAALEAEKERFRTLAEGVPQLVWRSAAAGRWTWAGPQWTAYTGLSDAESRGRGWLAAVHPDDLAATEAAWAAAGAGGAVRVEHRLRRAADGAWRRFQTRGTPVRGPGGAAEWVGTCTDVEDEARAREALERQQEVLEARVAERTAELARAVQTLHAEAREREEAEERLRQGEKLKAVGQLTGGIAHDFNNALQAIVGSLGLVRARVERGRGGEVLPYLARAEAGAARAAALTARLLAFGRRQALRPEPVDLDRLARGMEDLVRRTVGPAVQVEVKAGNGRWLVLADPDQVESALLNLYVNARDAMPDGGWLTVSTEELELTEADVAGHEDARPGRYAAVAVTDTGTGMPPEVAARAFEPFFTTKPPGQGTGLGLSQIWGFVRQSGGVVRLETAPGEGTTVRLCFPVHAPNPDAGEAERAAAAGPTVLLVEDEPDVRATTADALRDRGWRVLEAADGPAALRLLHAGARVDALVTDVGLPGGMDGRQVADAARERRPGLPVVFVTGFAGGVPIGDAGAEVLRKPFAPARLVERVGALLGAAAAGAAASGPDRA